MGEALIYCKTNQQHMPGGLCAYLPLQLHFLLEGGNALITRLKQSVWKLLAVGASSIGVLLCVLPSAAVAQDIAEVPAEGMQSADQYPYDLPTTDMTSQFASDPAAVAVETFTPSDPIWAISPERPEATATQIPDEVESISQANPTLMGDNPDPIASGQELMPPTVVEPATKEPAASEATMAEPETGDSTTKESAASESVDAALAFKSPLILGMTERQLCGLGIIILTIVLSVLIVWKQPMRPSPLLRAIVVTGGKPKGTHRARVSDLRGRLLRRGGATGIHSSSRRCFSQRASRRTREHRRRKGV